jgi:hypothetical protein
MDARWIPVFAAGLGVVGGVGGALAGGSLANEGQQRRFERERADAKQDALRETYGNYLATAQEILAKYAAQRPQPEVDAAYVRLVVAEARVGILAENTRVTEAAAELREALEAEPADKRLSDEEKRALEAQQLAAYQEAAETFRAVARDEIDELGG